MASKNACSCSRPSALVPRTTRTRSQSGATTSFVSSRTRSKHVSAELAYVVEVERLKGKFGAREDIAPYDLRATMIFRPEEGTWKVVHRHADQITATQPAESVIQE